MVTMNPYTEYNPSTTTTRSRWWFLIMCFNTPSHDLLRSLRSPSTVLHHVDLRQPTRHAVMKNSIAWYNAQLSSHPFSLCDLSAVVFVFRSTRHQISVPSPFISSCLRNLQVYRIPLRHHPCVGHTAASVLQVLLKI